MRKVTLCLAAFFVAASLATIGRAQDATAKKPNGTIGDVISVDPAKGVLTIKTLAGPEARASVTSKTEYLVVEPGKKDLTGASTATLADVKVGDRVWARGDAGADGAVAARQVVVMSAQAIAERNRRDAQDWLRRGVRGEVHAIDAATGEITIETYRGETVVVVVGTGTTLRHLKGSPMDLANSEPIALGDIQVGNQVAARGDKSADGARITAETVFAGQFARPVGGRVTSVDAAKNEVHVATRAGKDVTLTLASDAEVRKLTPPERPAGGSGQGAGPGAGAGQGTGAGSGSGTNASPAEPGAGGPPSSRPGAEGAGSSASPAARTGGPGGPGGPGGFGGPGGPDGRPRGGFGFGLDDRAELERRTSAITLADIAVGDIVFAVAEPGATDAAAHVKVLVKLDIPPGRFQRGPGGFQGAGSPPIGDPGDGGPPQP